ncbi:peptidyl-prolyl cis-trans isomerase FKBP16-3, chloroplastic [Euphorbia lathyris]|uniref:peptidyl-prolyl cis-trans isomerase FKBP16-3, chloroplastic n=1 Tax=Euphorbia lathyris TaxID=212925 RepID=UPI003313519E
MASSPSSLLLPIGSASANCWSASRHGSCCDKVRGFSVQCFNSELRVRGSRTRENKDDLVLIKRRDIIGLGFGVSSLLMIDSSDNAMGAGLPPEEKPRLCDDICEKELENVPMVTTESGLQYKDIKVGRGPSPPIGFQVAANYVAMVPSGQIFDSSLEKGQIYIFRVGSGQVIKGLDEGILSMKTGGKRRIYIPGPLAFPKGLNSAPGRPRVAPNSPVVFDVSLEFIPGLEEEEE